MEILDQNGAVIVQKEGRNVFSAFNVLPSDSLKYWQIESTVKGSEALACDAC